MLVDPRLKEWATALQSKYIDAVLEHGSVRGAEKALGLGHDTIGQPLRRLMKQAALKGYAPGHDMTHTAPDPFVVKGVSTYYDQDGKPRAQWVKTQLDHEKRLQIIKDTVEELVSGVPTLPMVAAPSTSIGALLNLYTMTDCHMGALAWKGEGGADWDLEIAQRVLGGCFKAMLDQAPPAAVGFLNQLGDWLHADSIMPTTPTSGHVLDAERFQKVVAAAVKILIQFVHWMLAKHETVIVLMAEGNHDISSSIWLRELFKQLFAGNPRVIVIDSALPYYAYQHGETMLAFHHGHMKKTDSLPLLFASEFPEIWGATKKRECHTGHFHHLEVKEHSGMRVRQHASLSARDAHSSRHGYLSEREATAFTYHEKHGRVGSVTVTPEMLDG